MDAGNLPVEATVHRGFPVRIPSALQAITGGKQQSESQVSKSKLGRYSGVCLSHGSVIFSWDIHCCALLFTSTHNLRPSLQRGYQGLISHAVD